MYFKNKKIICIANERLQTFLEKELGQSEHFHYVRPDDVLTGCFSLFAHYDYILTDAESYSVTSILKNNDRKVPLLILLKESEIDVCFSDCNNKHIIQIGDNFQEYLIETVANIDYIYKEYNEEVKSVSITKNSNLEMIDLVVHQMERFINSCKNIAQEDLFKINLISRELLTNAVRHGNKNIFNKRVFLSYYLIGSNKLRIRIKDQGLGFDYFSFLDKIKKEDELRVQHRGIFLIESFAQKIIPEGNQINIEIKL